MTVAELIEKLKEFPPDRVVVVDGYEGDFDDPIVFTGQALLNEGAGNYNGQHADLYYEDEETKRKGQFVVVVGRKEQ